MAIRLDLKTRFQRVLGKSRSISSGKSTTRQLTYIIDGSIFALYQSILQKMNLKDKLCIIAVGGYGRMELCPHSDIDILYLFEDLTDEQLAEVISPINNYLYDSGKQVGHSCRTIEESKQYLDNIQSFFAILDSRFLVGSETLYEKFLKEVLYNLPEELCKEYSDSKLIHLEKLVSIDRPFLVSEPNLKTDPFGLRDMQTIYWLEKLNPLIPSMSSRGKSRVFAQGEIQEFEDAYDFFLKLRTALHTIENRKNDRLDLRIQFDAAEYMGFGNKDQISSVEKLMRVFYSHQKHIYHFIASYLDYNRIKGKYHLLEDTNIEGFSLEKLESQLYPSRLGNFFTYPETLNKDIMNIFYICQKHNLEISPILFNELRFVSQFLDDDFKNSKIAIEIFLTLIRNAHNVGKILTIMHHCNILGKLIPEFGASKYFALFSYHHEYPVDEHSLYILRELDKLVDGQFDDVQVQKEFDQCKDIHILILAILIHDAGKVKSGDHCKYGGELANAVGERMGLLEEEIELLHFLVEAHIDMSELSTKRDISDPELVKRFANSVQTESRLRLLYIFTIIDTKSVGPSVLTGWKKDILYTLFKNTLHYFNSTDNFLLASKQEHAIESLKIYLFEKEKIPAKFMEGIMNFAKSIIPESYITYNSPRRILHQYTNYTKYLQDPFSIPFVEFENEPSYTNIMIYTKDYKYLPCDIAGTLSSMGLNVAGMRTFRAMNGFSINQIQITDNYGGGGVPEDKMNRFKDLIKKVTHGELNVEQLLSSPSHFFHFNLIPEGMVEEKIEFDNNQLDNYTILEIRVPDELGLLYKVTKQILSMNVHLDFVRIATSADYAFDSFYLRGEDGGKILNDSLMEELRGKIKASISKHNSRNN